jgi:ABC-type multidrug transport system fused ATPase/permease subunit
MLNSHESRSLENTTNDTLTAFKEGISNTSKTVRDFLLSEINLPGFPKEITPPMNSAHKPGFKPIGLFQAAKLYLKAMHDNFPVVFWKRNAILAADVISQSGITLLIAPIVTTLHSAGFDTKAQLLTGALAVCFMLRDWANKNRDYVSDAFFRRQMNNAEQLFLTQHLSRSIAAIGQVEYNNRVTKVREQPLRFGSFIARLYEVATSAFSVGIAWSSLCIYNSNAAFLVLGISALFIANYHRYAKRFNITDNEVSEPRRELTQRRTHVTQLSSTRELKFLGKEAHAIKAVKEADLAMSNPRLRDLEVLEKDIRLPIALSYISRATVLGVSLHSLALGALTVEHTLQVLALYLFVESQIHALNRFYGNLLQDLALVQEASNLHEHGEDELSDTIKYTTLDPNKPPVIEINQVSYSILDANGKQHSIVNNVSQVFQPGKIYGICGFSGAGKTTLLRMLMGIIKPTEGTITFDQIMLEEINPINRKDLISYLPQDYSSFEACTVREAVSLGVSASHLPPSNERILNALECASATFIGPDDLKAVIGHDYTHSRDFSGGERQRIAIGRAIAGDKPVIILDEPGAALDHKNEDAIIDNIRRLAQDPNKPKTIIIISHRITSLRHTDEIIFLHKGQITERGDHEELIKLDGEYAKLFAREEILNQNEEDENSGK